MKDEVPVADNPRLLERAREQVSQPAGEELAHRALRAELELERYRTLAGMVAELAHEVNTPLSIVRAAAGLLGELAQSDVLAGVGTDVRAREALRDLRQMSEMVESGILRAETLIRDFKALSAGQVHGTLERTCLRTTVEGAMRLFAINARRAGLDVRLRCTLPPDQSMWTGYPGYLGQVLLNVLTNVERYAYPDGAGGVVEVGMSLGQGGSHAPPPFVVTVRDYGCGIPADRLQRVFDRSYTTGRGAGGTGLGLAIVRDLVTNKLRGEVWMESAPGQGTCVTITLPQRVPGAEVQAAPAIGASATALAGGSEPRQPRRASHPFRGGARVGPAGGRHLPRHAP